MAADKTEYTEAGFQEVTRLFDSLADLPAGERERVLSGLAGGRTALANTVRSLLDAHDRERAASLEAAGAKAGAGAPGASAGEGLDLRFGNYRAVRPLGQGGMGMVYLAERADGQFTRQAAVKVIGTALEGDLYRWRFLTERQILANLEHPHIARLLDGGVTEEGLPYFVMEYVDGERLDAFCDARKLSVAGRLALFLKICEAVDFAHRNLVIHCDLKPSNILVTADGEPKLLDFGTARLASGTPGEPGKAPQFLTPRYASPEQLRQEPVTVAADVYALGVVLFELLAGRWPFGNPESPLAVWQRAFQAVPVTRLAEGVTEEIAGQRGVSGAGLRRELEGDLTWILERALATDPAARYPSVRALAEDLRRYREHRPVEAHPPSAAYRAGKWLRRNRWGVGVAAVVLLALGTGAYLREQQRQLAEKRFESLRSLARYQLFELQDRLFYGFRTEPVRGDMAQRSLAVLDALSAESGGNKDLEVDLVLGYARLAELLGSPLKANLAKPDQAKVALSRARALATPLAARYPDDREVRMAEAVVAIQEAAASYATENKPAIEKMMQALDRWRGSLDLGTAPARELERLATAYQGAGRLATQSSGLVDAQSGESSWFVKARELYERAEAKEPGNVLIQIGLAETDIAEGGMLETLDPGQARRLNERALARLRRLPESEKSNRSVMGLEAQVLQGIGWAAGQQKEYPVAIDYLSQAARVLETIRQIDGGPQSKFGEAGAWRSLGFVLGYAGKKEESAAALERAAALMGEITTPKSPPHLTMLRGENLVRAGMMRYELQQREPARALMAEGLKKLIEVGTRPGATAPQMFLAARYLATVPFEDLKNPGRAVQLAGMGIKKDPEYLYGYEIWASTLESAGLYKDAVAAIDALLARLPADSKEWRGRLGEDRRRMAAKVVN